jgi:hypothetical protein
MSIVEQNVIVTQHPDFLAKEEKKIGRINLFHFNEMRILIEESVSFIIYSTNDVFEKSQNI